MLRGKAQAGSAAPARDAGVAAYVSAWRREERGVCACTRQSAIRRKRWRDIPAAPYAAANVVPTLCFAARQYGSQRTLSSTERSSRMPVDGDAAAVERRLHAGTRSRRRRYRLLPRTKGRRALPFSTPLTKYRCRFRHTLSERARSAAVRAMLRIRKYRRGRMPSPRALCAKGVCMVRQIVWYVLFASTAVSASLHVAARVLPRAR